MSDSIDDKNSLCLGHIGSHHWSQRVFEKTKLESDSTICLVVIVSTAPCALTFPPAIQTQRAHCISLSLTCSHTKPCSGKVSVRETPSTTLFSLLFTVHSLKSFFTSLLCGSELHQLWWWVQCVDWPPDGTMAGWVYPWPLVKDQGSWSLSCISFPPGDELDKARTVQRSSYLPCDGPPPLYSSLLATVQTGCKSGSPQAWAAQLSRSLTSVT